VVAFGATVSFWGLTHVRHPDGVSIPVLLIDNFIEAGTAPSGSGVALTRAVVAKLSKVSGLSAKRVKSVPLDDTSTADANPLVLRAYVSSTPWLKGVQVSVRLINGLTGEGIAYGDFPYHAASDRTVGEIADFVRVEAGRYRRTERLADLSPRNAEAIREAATLGVLGDSLRGEGEVEPALAAFAAADSLLAATAGGQLTVAKTLAARADIWLGRAWVFVTPEAFDVAAFRNAARRALILADSALDLDKRSARALEVKGFAAHMLWQFLPADSVAALRRFVDMSEATLRTAVEIAPARARSWALLAAILYVKGQYDDALDAAQRAYTANAFLEQSSDVLHRLYSSALETGDAKSARTWCQEIARRFADSWMDADCRLQLLAWSKPTQDQFKTASLLVARHRARHAHPDQLVARLEMVLGVVGAKAGLPVDSALAIQNHALAASPHDPELAPVRAWLWRAVDRPDSAHVVMSAYVGADPIRRAGLMKSRRFRIDVPKIAVNQSLQ
jgi:tetratricopeptide (TPR) repeat protein